MRLVAGYNAAVGKRIKWFFDDAWHSAKGETVQAAIQAAIGAAMPVLAIFAGWPWQITLPFAIVALGLIFWALIRWHRRIPFYESRTRLPKLSEQVRRAKDVWAAWHTAAELASSRELKNEKVASKFTRVVLLKPNQEGYLKLHAPHYGTLTLAFMEQQIRQGTSQLLQDGVKEVRWFDGPILSMVILDPDADHAEARIEPWGPMLDSSARPSFVVRKRVYPKLFEHLKASYEELWGKSESVANA